jgi:sugar lactone lactonase YvrE
MDGLHPLLRSALGLFRAASSTAAESLWWDPSGGLYWCVSETGALHFSSLGAPVDGAADTVLKLPPLLAAFAPAPEGFVVAGKNAVALVGLNGSFQRTLARIHHEDEHTRFNESKCDPYGRFILGTAGAGGFSNGTIYSVDPSGESKAIYASAGLITGMQWSDDGTRMWFMDSLQSTIFSCDYSPYGEMTRVQPFIRGVRGEGLARDIDDGFWTSSGGGAVARWDANGRQTLELEIPVKRITSLTFGGPELATLFIATSRAGVTAADLERQPLAGSIFGIETATRGFPTRRFGRA